MVFYIYDVGYRKSHVNLIAINHGIVNLNLFIFLYCLYNKSHDFSLKHKTNKCFLLYLHKKSCYLLELFFYA